MENEKKFSEKFFEVVALYNDAIASDNLVLDYEDKYRYNRYFLPIREKNKKLIATHRADDHEPCKELTNLTRQHDYILRKLRKMEMELVDYDNQLSFYYKELKFSYTWMSFSVIFLSCMISFFEAFHVILGKGEKFASIVSLSCGTSITFITSWMKFRSLKDRMEHIVQSKEKVTVCKSKLFFLDKELKLNLRA